MRILIDGDGCPVVRETAALSQEFSVPCLIFCDTSHSFSLPGVETILCDRGADALAEKATDAVTDMKGTRPPFSVVRSLSHNKRLHADNAARRTTWATHCPDKPSVLSL